MTDIILGLVGFLLGIAAFAAGYGLALHGGKQPKARINRENGDDGHSAAAAEERAFRALTGYSADIAYGVAAFPGEDEF